MPYVYPNRFNMYYNSAGSGHPVLLIPGVGYGGWFWHRVERPLIEKFHVITPDPRGSGASDKTPGPYPLARLVADYAGLLDQLQVRGAYLMGHGLGGYLALSLALDRPELVSKLVLAATTFGGPDAVPATEAAVSMMTDRGGEPLDIIRRNVEATVTPAFQALQPEAFQELIDYRLSGAVPPESYQAQARAGASTAAAENSLAERLTAISVPTLLLYGEEDQITPVANAALMSERLPEAGVVILPGAGHLFPIEAPEATVSAVVEFLGGARYGE